MFLLPIHKSSSVPAQVCCTEPSGLDGNSITRELVYFWLPWNQHTAHWRALERQRDFKILLQIQASVLMGAKKVCSSARTFQPANPGSFSQSISDLKQRKVTLAHCSTLLTQLNNDRRAELKNLPLSLPFLSLQFISAYLKREGERKKREVIKKGKWFRTLR